MRKKRVYLLFITIAIILTGCFLNKERDFEIVESGLEDKLEENKKEEVVYKSPLSGLEIHKDLIGKRPIGVMIDNHNRARWQAGLKDAELVYEIPVEGNYTRYMAIYLKDLPETIGPIRSARAYFVTKALELDTIYIHVGGSPEAKRDIKTLGISDIDGLSAPQKTFWRASHKKAPNNLYSSKERIEEEIARKNFRRETEKNYFKFNDEDKGIDGQECKEVKINYIKPNTTSYIYDEEDGKYFRYKDGKIHIDESDKSEIKVKNIIIQNTTIRVMDNEGRLSVNLIGGGTGKYLTNGKIMDISWQKDTITGKTIYKDMDGEEIKLNPGNTWVQIVDINSNIEVIGAD